MIGLEWRTGALASHCEISSSHLANKEASTGKKKGQFFRMTCWGEKKLLELSYTFSVSLYWKEVSLTSVQSLTTRIAQTLQNKRQWRSNNTLYNSIPKARTKSNDLARPLQGVKCNRHFPRWTFSISCKILTSNLLEQALWEPTIPIPGAQAQTLPHKYSRSLVQGLNRAKPGWLMVHQSFVPLGQF